METAMVLDERQFKENQLKTYLEKLHEWLRPVNTSVPSFVDRERGTCEWIFNHPVYQQWKDSRFQKPLWIYGIPGCGKSVMASFLSQMAESRFSLRHFFRSSSDQDSTKASYLACSILAQLIRDSSVTSAPQFLSMIQGALPLFDHFGSCVDCPFTKLWPLIDELFSILADFTLVVDALDECSDMDRSTVITKWLSNISDLPNARVIILSRYHARFEESLRKSFHLHMDAEVVSSDISLFVNYELQRTPKLQRIEKEIMEKAKEAQGMFLWAKMMMEYLKAAATPKIQLRRLARFPSGLAAVYDGFLVETAASLEEDDIIRRREIFMLLTAAVRPLSVNEISTALALKSAETPPDGGDLLLDPKAEVLRLCWPLAMVVRDWAQLVHMSVKEYLLQSTESYNKGSVRFSSLDCNGFMARRCLNRLSYQSYAATDTIERVLGFTINPKNISDTEIAKLPQAHTFYEYACRSWQSHVVTAQPAKNLLLQTDKFLHSLMFITWAESLYSISRVDMGPILEVRALLRSWHITVPHLLHPFINVGDSFVGPYSSAYSLLNNQGDELTPYVILERLGVYFNLAVEQRPKNNLGPYDVLKLVSEGYERILGERHPKTLRTTALFCVERFAKKEYSVSEAISSRIASIQREVLDEDVYDYYRTRQYEGLALFFQMKYAQARECQRESYAGLERTLGALEKDTLKSQLFLGWCVEAEEDLETALGIYKNIWEAWVPIKGPDNPLSLFSQCCMAIVHRKLGDLVSAEKHMTENFAARQPIFGDNNLITIDTALNLAVLYRDMDRPVQVHALLQLAETIGLKNQGFERLCQVEHLRALMEVSAGQRDDARRRMQILLHKAATEGHCNNQELFWVRLSLAEILRSEGLNDEAFVLFSGIVKVTQHSSSGDFSNDPDAPYQLRVAEVALETVRKRDIIGAEELLHAHGLEWCRPEDLWLLESGPPVETQ